MNFQPIIVTQLTVAAPFAKRNGGWPSNVKCTLMKAHFYLLFIFLTLMTSGLLVLPPLSVDVGTMKIIIPAQIQTDLLQIRNLSPQKIQIRESRRLRPQIKRISFIIFFFSLRGGKKGKNSETSFFWFGGFWFDASWTLSVWCAQDSWITLLCFQFPSTKSWRGTHQNPLISSRLNCYYYYVKDLLPAT